VDPLLLRNSGSAGNVTRSLGTGTTGPERRSSAIWADGRAWRSRLARFAAFTAYDSRDTW
jgi:hypothetical protein